MALFPQYVVCKFIAGLSEKEVGDETQKILAAFFGSIAAQEIQRGGDSYSVENAIENIAEKIAKQEPPSGALPEFVAQVAMQSKMTAMPKDSLSYSVSFVAEDALQTKSQWELFLHRGPLPMLELRTYHGRCPKLRKGWIESLVNCGVAHFIWVDSKYGIGKKTVYGTGDNQYLFWKRQALFPFSRGSSSDEAVEAGFRLRQLCRRVWERQHVHFERASIFPPWRSRKKKLIENFDKGLLNEIGREEIGVLLRAIGMSLESWLRAE